MSKKIKYTTDDINKILEKIKSKKKKKRGVSNGKVTIDLSSTSSEKEQAYMLFSPIAYAKMMYLTLSTSDEIGWHGYVKREGDNIFHVYDIVVYPQIVTKVTVETDEVEYPNWIGDIAMDDSFFDLRFHGHSHVNMGCSPSGTDLENRKGYLSQFKDNTDKDMFYLFLIMNKKGEHTAEIYDYTNNILYEDKDIIIDVCIEDDNFLSLWEKEAKTKVRKHTVVNNNKNSKTVSKNKIDTDLESILKKYNSQQYLFNKGDYDLDEYYFSN